MALKHAFKLRLFRKLRRVERPHTSVQPVRFRGQSLVEFSLVSLLLMTLVAGVVDLGRGVYTRTTLSNAVREAARYGATDPTNSEGIIAAANQRSAGLKLAQDGNLIQSFADNKGYIHCTDRNYAWMPPLRADKVQVPAVLGFGLAVVAPAFNTDRISAASNECVSDYFFRVNGRLTNPADQLPASGLQGATVKVEYTLSGNCINVRTSLISYKTDPNDKDKIISTYDSAYGGPYNTATGGSLEVEVPNDPNYGYKVVFSINGETRPSPTPVPPTATATNTPTVTPSPTKTPVPPTLTPTNTPNVPATQTAVTKATQTSVAATSTAVYGQTATTVAQATQTAVSGSATSVAGTTTAVANQTATSVAKTATAIAPTPTFTATPNVPATQTAGVQATQTAASASQTAVGLTATARTNGTQTAVAKTATSAVNKTNTAVAGATNTVIAGATNTVVAQTATTRANLTATVVTQGSQTAVAASATAYVQTATTVAGTTTAIAKTGTVAAQTATSSAQTAVAVTQTSVAATQTSVAASATSVSLTATASAPTPTPDWSGGLGDDGDPIGATTGADGKYIPQNCKYPRVGNLLTVCAQTDFNLALPRLIGLGTIPMKECATVDIQSKPEK